MYCPQCATESSPGLQYCRSCGANLKVIGKAVALSEAIARSDRGLVPKLKEMAKNLRVEHVTEEVSRALDRVNQEIARTPREKRPSKPWWLQKEKKTPQERREDQFVKGTISLFSGIGLMIFLYFFAASVVLKLPPDWIAKIPFELESLLRVLWLVGMVPTLSGAGHIVAGLLIRRAPPQSIDAPAQNVDGLSPAPPGSIDAPAHSQRPVFGNPAQQAVPSVTERTTNLLEPTGLDAPSHSDGDTVR
jgi:hypothetical protein